MLTKKLDIIDADRCVGCLSCVFACARRYGEGGYDRSAIAVRSAAGVEKGFVVIVCRACMDPPCAKVCPTNALVAKKGGGVFLNPNKCIGCGFCRNACPIGAVMWDEAANKPIICVQCGYCVDFCPHGVIGIVERQTEGV